MRTVLRVALWIVVAGAAAFGAVIAVQGARLERAFRREARELLAARPSPVPLEMVSQVSLLPPPVVRYLGVAGVTRRPPVRTVRLRHGGTFQPAVDGRPFAIRGEQYLTADPPGFVWWGRIRIAPGLWVDGRDRSVQGAGRMRIQAVSTFTIADRSGPELDEGALQRLLGELTWCPTALLDGRWVRWEPIDDASARARLKVAGREVAVTFHFGADGLPARVTAERWRDAGGKAIRTPWQGECSDYREVGGLKVPFRLAATWILDGKPFTYARWEVERLELDATEPW